MKPRQVINMIEGSGTVGSWLNGKFSAFLRLIFKYILELIRN